jgi:hypothetical protein
MPAISLGTTSAVFEPTAWTGTTPPANASAISGRSVADTTMYTGSATAKTQLLTALDDNVVDMAAGTFSIADLRLTLRIQEWMERNARCGARYTEWLLAHYDVFNGDARLQRSTYIGGSRQPMIINEVLQTSEPTADPLGTMGGHGLSANRTFIADYYCKDYGWIIGLMSIMPRTAYQQGIDKQFLRETKFDYYHPEFANISEQAVMTGELYLDDTGNDNNVILGYQAAYDEYKTKRSIIVGDMRSDFDHWHISRQFASAPTLTTDFLECKPRKDNFAVPGEHGYMFNIGNKVKCIRPMPAMAIPSIT